MAKQTGQQKAKVIVSKALNTFTKAIEEVQKANDLLIDEVQNDEQKLKDITSSIEAKYKQLDAVQSDKMNKEAEIIQNKELIGKLEKFTR